MTSRLAILCPGQGGQHANMYKFLDSGMRADALLKEWSIDDALGMPLDAALSDNAALFANRIAQPLIVGATLAAWEIVKEVLPQPALVVGYSIGELSSYAVAGSLLPADALAIAARRAKLMDDCAHIGPAQALLAVSGLELKAVAGLLPPDGMFIAIETGIDSAIVGGERELVPRFEQQLAQLGAHTVLLPVEVASHTPLMRAAAAPFREELGNYRFADPIVPVVAGVSADMVYDRGVAKATLVRQLHEKLVWRECMESCSEAGITIALELGPGNALSRMLNQRHPQIECRSIMDFRSVAGIGTWIRRHFGG